MKKSVVLGVGIGLAVVSMTVALISSGQTAAVSSFVRLGSLYQGIDFHSQPWDVSADGTTVVGNSGAYGFVWKQDTGIVALPALPFVNPGSGGDGVSGDGSMAAGSVYSEAGQEACRWTWDNASLAWAIEPLGDLAAGSFCSVGFGMSADGNVVVGFGNSAKGQEACRWSLVDGTWVIQGLGDLPGGSFASEAYGCSADGSVVVGDSAIKNGWRAFRWTAATGMKDLGVVGNRKWGAAYGCSGDGNVVVGESFANRGKDEIAFRWTQKTGMVGLGDLPGGKALSEAEAADYDGSIIVGWSATARGMEAFVWDAANGMRGVEAVLATKGISIPAGWILKSATGVTSSMNELGQRVVTIVGNGTYMIDGQSYNEGWLAVIADYR
jgi:probable HAF family extracellular repeat protein